jgi:hypothetical protein
VPNIGYDGLSGQVKGIRHEASNRVIRYLLFVIRYWLFVGLELSALNRLLLTVCRLL